MIIEYTEGCTAYSLDIDGFPLSKTHDNALKPIIKNLMTFLKKKCQQDRSYLQELLIVTVNRFGDSESIFHCDQCGDDVIKTTLNTSLRRNKYIRGVKAYLASFEIGEVRRYDRNFAWKSIMSAASRMKFDFGCEFKMNWKDKTITRIA